MSLNIGITDDGKNDRSSSCRLNMPESSCTDKSNGGSSRTDGGAATATPTTEAVIVQVVVVAIAAEELLATTQTVSDIAPRCH